jgi:putative Mg2+ transporter-C (MgtC) family protein
MHLDFLFNTAVALVLGLAIGLERQWRQHQAGLRTNTLVALGAALFVSLSQLLGDTGSPTRVASYVVSGLGFLGAGVILRDGLTVKGLNTAATIWCTGAVGTLAGCGFSVEAAVGTCGVLGVNMGLRPLVAWIEARSKTTTDIETLYRMRVTCAEASAAHVRAILMRHIGGKPRMSVQGISTMDDDKEGKVIVAEAYAMEAKRPRS